MQRKKRLMTVVAICIGVVASIGLYWHFKPKAKFEDKFLAKLQKYSPPITELQSLPQVPPKYHSESLEQFKQLQHQFQPNYHRQNIGKTFIFCYTVRQPEKVLQRFQAA